MSEAWRIIRDRLIQIPSKGLLVGVHDRGTCIGDHCTIHNPSDHHMRNMYLHWRSDRGIFERICQHGVGHPDPDQQFRFGDSGAHGCCVQGCCRRPENPLDKTGVHDLMPEID